MAGANADKHQYALDAALVAERTQRLQALGFKPADADLLAHDGSVDIGLVEAWRAQGADPASALHAARACGLQMIQERYGVLAWARVPLRLQGRLATDERYDLARLAALVELGCRPDTAVRLIMPDDASQEELRELEPYREPAPSTHHLRPGA